MSTLQCWGKPIASFRSKTKFCQAIFSICLGKKDLNIVFGAPHCQEYGKLIMFFSLKFVVSRHSTTWSTQNESRAILKMVICLCPANGSLHKSHNLNITSKEPRRHPHTSLLGVYGASFLVLLLLKIAPPS